MILKFSKYKKHISTGYSFLYLVYLLITFTHIHHVEVNFYDYVQIVEHNPASDPYADENTECLVYKSINIKYNTGQTVYSSDNVFINENNFADYYLSLRTTKSLIPNFLLRAPPVI